MFKPENIPRSNLNIKTTDEFGRTDQLPRQQRQGL